MCNVNIFRFLVCNVHIIRLLVCNVHIIRFLVCNVHIIKGAALFIDINIHCCGTSCAEAAT